MARKLRKSGKDQKTKTARSKKTCATVEAAPVQMALDINGPTVEADPLNGLLHRQQSS
jgi:hypothetical protein